MCFLFELLWRRTHVSGDFMIYFFPMVFVAVVIAEWWQEKQKKRQRRKNVPANTFQ